MNTHYNPYAPPKAPSSAERRLPRVKPRPVVWAVTGLWLAYGITLAHAIIILGGGWRSWPPELGVVNQVVFEVVCAALIYFVSSGRYWARLIYGVYLGVRTVNVIQHAPADWHVSHGLFLMTLLSFTCQYVAMYWLFTEPGRRWFMRRREK